MEQKNLNRIFQTAIVLSLLLFFALILAQSFSLATADIGRHIKNGEMVLKEHFIPRTNLYSYTYPDFPFLNHHWGSGVIFYLVFKAFGFGGFSFLQILIGLATLLLFFHTAWRYSGFKTAALVTLLTIPLLSTRAEIRPEMFSYLLAGVFFWILFQWRQQKISKNWLWVLPPLLLLWVNLHIYFVFGLMLIGVFWLEAAIKKFFKKDQNFTVSFNFLSLILFLSAGFSLINPFGLSGALAPFQIFNQYGYRILENQSVWFLYKIIPYPQSLYFIIVFTLLVLSWVYAFFAIKKGKQNFYLPLALISATFSFLGWFMVRNFAIFGYFAISIIAINFSGFFNKPFESARDYSKFLTIFVLLFGFLIFINPLYWQNRSLGWGLDKGNEAAAEFFKANNLHGPIFNNYDIGGYLTFYLFPKERVFVDNRPEAYPASFFKDVYIPMQEDSEKWKNYSKQSNINTIFFYRNDLTPWAQKFLIARVSDPDWVPIFVDDWNIIFIKKDGPDKEQANRLALPPEMFKINNQ